MPDLPYNPPVPDPVPKPKPTERGTLKVTRTRYVVLGPPGRETTYDTHTGELHDGIYPPPEVADDAAK